tara:strand:- start:574 stop:885 length:312 start_codon:yes stop_codon:yes gene_type:complete
MSKSPTFVELLEEFTKTYSIDAMGMSIENIKSSISEEDCVRLDRVVNPPECMQYRLTAYIEIEVSSETEAEDKTTRIMKEVVKGLDEQDKLLHVDLKDITEGE